MVPTMMLIIPQFLLAKNLGLLNSLPGLVLFYTGGTLALNTFLLRELLPGHPARARRGDGRRRRRAVDALLKLVLPLSKPALATVGIFSFLASWDEFVWALTVINDPNKRTLPIAIALFQGEHSTSWGLVFAASLDRDRAGARCLRDLPAALRQRPDHRSAEGLMAIATGDLLTERSLAVLRDGQSRSGAFVASPTLPRLPLRLAPRRRLLRARARPRRRSPLRRARGTAGSQETIERHRAAGRGGDRARRRGGRPPATRCCPPATRSTGRSRARIRRALAELPDRRLRHVALVARAAPRRPPLPTASRAPSSSSAATSRRRGGSRAGLLGGVRRPASTRRRSPPPAPASTRRRGCIGERDVRRRGRARARGAPHGRYVTDGYVGLAPGDDARRREHPLARRPVRRLRRRRPARRRDRRRQSSAS